MKKLATIIILVLLSINSVFAETQTLILLDASSSMNKKFDNNSLFYYAIYAVFQVLNSYNYNDQLGLRIIGLGKDDNLTNIILNLDTICYKTHLAIPIGPNTKNSIYNVTRSILPLGVATPLEYTLRQAINYDFAITGDLKHIILITDGGENCGGDPCRYIREIRATRNDIRIDIIALAVPDEDFPLFNCLANETNGQFINILKPENVGPAVKQIMSQRPNVEYKEAKMLQPAIKMKHVKPVNRNKIIYKKYLLEIWE